MNTALTQTAWMPAAWLSRQPLSPAWFDWLSDAGSLTQRLRAFTQGAIQHQLCEADWADALADECDALSLSQTDRVWLRHMRWLYQAAEWVDARVIIPTDTLQVNAAQLSQLGKQSLGDILFASPSLRRSPFEYQCVEGIDGQKHWRRRSVFYFHEQPLLVTETFLPAFLENCKQTRVC